MGFLKIKDIEIKGLLHEIEEANKEDRCVLFDIDFNTGIVTYTFNDINIKEMEAFIKDIDKKKVLILDIRSGRKRMHRLYIDITDDTTFNIRHFDENGLLEDPLTSELKPCIRYSLYTKETSMHGFHTCEIKIKIEKKQN